MLPDGSPRLSTTVLVLAVLMLSSIAFAQAWGGAGYGGYRGGGALGHAMATLIGMLAIIMIPYGILQCYFGYRLFKIILGVIGFIFGALIGAVIVAAAGGERGVVILLSLLFGVGGAYLSIALYFVGVFLVGAGAGAALVQVLSQGDAGTGGVIAGAIVVGIIALVVQKVVIIVSTSLSGAYSIAGFIALSADRLSVGAFAGLFILFFVSGMLVQFLVTAKNAPKDVGEQLKRKKAQPEAVDAGSSSRMPDAGDA